MSDSLLQILTRIAPLSKVVKDDGTCGVGAPLTGLNLLTGELTTKYTDVCAVGIDFTNKIEVKQGEEGLSVTVVDFLAMMGLATQSDLDSIPRITKEQFYDLNA